MSERVDVGKIIRILNISEENNFNALQNRSDGVVVFGVMEKSCKRFADCTVRFPERLEREGRVELSSTAVVTVTTLEGVSYTHTFTGLSGRGSLADASTKFFAELSCYLRQNGYVLTE